MNKLVLVIMFLFSMSVYSQSGPNKGPTKEDWVLLATHASFRALDVYSTRQALANGGQEVFLPNSIAGNTPTMAAYSAACVVTDWFVTQQLVKHGHPKIAHVITMIDIGQVAPGAINNLFIHK